MNQCQLQIVESLVLKVSEQMKVEPTLLKGRTKREEYCIARALVWVICKDHHCLTFRSIGSIFDGRDHSTVWSGYRIMKDEIEVNKERRLIYKKLVNG